MIKLSVIDIKVGDTFHFKFITDSNNEFKIVSINEKQNLIHIKNLNKNNDPVETSLKSFLKWLKDGDVKSTKHEYSPVQMTGYYKTVGD